MADDEVYFDEGFPSYVYFVINHIAQNRNVSAARRSVYYYVCVVTQKMYAKSSGCIWMRWINVLLSCDSLGLFEWVAGLSDLNKVKNVYHFTIKIYILQL